MSIAFLVWAMYFLFKGYLQPASLGFAVAANLTAVFSAIAMTLAATLLMPRRKRRDYGQWRLL
ncbi:hypothetical protein [Bryobacter aggregatus]|uniref:hypothetical protein n=1 Tax=Bryobacter aggregatus TaxID=360054 RepID=UPI0004E1D902|nr:hypothetical protein [Bryobacter aggregatus]